MRVMFMNNSNEWETIPTINQQKIESTAPYDVSPRINDMSTEITFSVDPCEIRRLLRSKYNNWRRRHGIPMIRYKEILRAEWGKRWRKYK